LDFEVSDVAAAQSNELQTNPGNTLESTARRVRTEWAELLDRIEIKVGGEDDEEAEVMKQVFWTGVVHSLQVRSLSFSSFQTLMRIFISVPKRAARSQPLLVRVR
jgi:putative alpha-1,2-mannosidase